MRWCGGALRREDEASGVVRHHEKRVALQARSAAQTNKIVGKKTLEEMGSRWSER
jgi:hypothetical protein